MVKNDSRDREYNIIEVYGAGTSQRLKPDEYVILPKGTREFSVNRAYQAYTRSYTVRCPEIRGSGIVVKLIDIHVNRISGGCETIRGAKG